MSEMKWRAMIVVETLAEHPDGGVSPGLVRKVPLALGSKEEVNRAVVTAVEAHELDRITRAIDGD